MWLINVDTYKLEYYIGDSIPAYAILSHTWETEEVSFQDIQNLDNAKLKAGFWKIEQTCKEATRRNIRYAWVDTCCIDKTSSSELQEAINSMFAWYAGSEVCFAYLVDVETGPIELDTNFGAIDPFDFETIGISRWFTRGWTLQELIAPRNLSFYNHGWTCIGDRTWLAEGVAATTGIPMALLARYSELGDTPETSLQSYSIAQRMSWASHRKTTRVEDRAYSMLGIFEVAMPMLYGEGKNAFSRLQAEIMRSSNDLSIFAWQGRLTDAIDHRVLIAESPECFADSAFIVSDDSEIQGIEFSLTNAGLRASMSLSYIEDSPSLEAPIRDQITPGGGLVVLLHCHDLRHPENSLALRVRSADDKLYLFPEQYMAKVNLVLSLGWLERQNTRREMKASRKRKSSIQEHHDGELRHDPYTQTGPSYTFHGASTSRSRGRLLFLETPELDRQQVKSLIIQKQRIRTLPMMATNSIRVRICRSMLNDGGLCKLHAFAGRGATFPSRLWDSEKLSFSLESTMNWPMSGSKAIRSHVVQILDPPFDSDFWERGALALEYDGMPGLLILELAYRCSNQMAEIRFHLHYENQLTSENSLGEYWTRQDRSIYDINAWRVNTFGSGSLSQASKLHTQWRSVPAKCYFQGVQFTVIPRYHCLPGSTIYILDIEYSTPHVETLD